MNKKIINFALLLLICFVFVDIVGAETYNNYESSTLSCGNGYVTGIPSMIPKIVSILYTLIQIAVPVVLVVIGSLDLVKGITAQKEDEMKKGQQLFIKKLITAGLIFFVFIAVKFLISLVANDAKDPNRVTSIVECAECFIQNECD